MASSLDTLSSQSLDVVKAVSQRTRILSAEEDESGFQSRLDAASRRSVVDRDGTSSASLNPPVDLSSMEDTTAALNPPVRRDIQPQSLTHSTKAISTRTIRGTAASRTTRARKQNVSAGEDSFSNRHGGQVHRRSMRSDNAWLQPLVPQPASGAYLPRRLFGFPSEFSGSFPRSGSVPAIPNMSRRTRSAAGLERSKLAPIKEADDSSLSILKTQRSDEVMGALYGSLAISDHGDFEVVDHWKRQPKVPVLYHPRFGMLGYGLVWAWACLCLRAVLDMEDSGQVTVGSIWSLAVVFGVMQEILVHQNLRAAVTAAALGFARHILSLIHI